MLDIEEEWFFRDESPTHRKDVLLGTLSFLLCLLPGLSLGSHATYSRLQTRTHCAAARLFDGFYFFISRISTGQLEP